MNFESCSHRSLEETSDAGVTFTVTDLNERAFLAQALAWYREMRTVCCEGPDGQALAQTEQVARDGGRELVRAEL